MNYLDMYNPYSPETRGDLKEYLSKYDGSQADNMFKGSKYFHEVIKNGWFFPNFTSVRVNRSPAPDISLVVREDGKLEGFGTGEMNMSCVGAEKGVYEPEEVLEDVIWSISPLKLL